MVTPPSLVLVRAPDGTVFLRLKTCLSPLSDIEKEGSIMGEIPLQSETRNMVSFGGSTFISTFTTISLSNPALYRIYKEAFESFLNEVLRVRLGKVSTNNSDPLGEFIAAITKLIYMSSSGIFGCIIDEAEWLVHERDKKP
jgi:hypothetical protein